MIKISQRVNKSITNKVGWRRRKNKSKEVCDICGARLWISPGGDKYCNNIHANQPKEKPALKLPRRKTQSASKTISSNGTMGLKITSWKLIGYDQKNKAVNLSDMPNDVAQTIDDWIADKFEER